MSARPALLERPLEVAPAARSEPKPAHRPTMPVVSGPSGAGVCGAGAVRLALRDRLAAESAYWRGERVLHLVESRPRAVKADRAHDRNPHYQLGLLLAPAYLCFARHVLEHADSFDRVYFLSREGWMFMRMYHRLAGALGVRASKPRGTYLAVNRRVSFLASMEGLTQPEIARIWKQYPGQTLRQLLRNLCLPEDVFFDLAARHGLTDPDRPIRRPRMHPEFSAFVADPHVRRAFLMHRDRMRELLGCYLGQRGFLEASRVALVDVGWKGSIQTNLHRAVRGLAGCPEVYGMYFGLDHDPAMDAPASTRHGFFCDTRAGDWITESLLTNNSVFEMFATAPHGTVAGYQRDARGWVHATAHAEPAESRNFRGRFREVWQGIRDYTDDFLDTPEAVEAGAALLRPAIADRLRRYALYPTRSEARAFLEYSHVESFGVFGVSRFHFRGSWRWILTRRPLRHAPARLWQTVRAQRWAPGVLRRSRVPMATFANDLLETIRRSRR
jgi:hypothetical protein